MDEETKSILRAQNDKIDKVIETLTRIENRQIKTTAMVEAVEKQEQTQQLGSFGTVDTGDKHG